MKNFIEKGGRIQVTAPAGGIASGDLVILGSNKAVVAVTSAAEDGIAICQTKGVFEIAKAAEAISQGVKLYWNSTNKNLTATATSNTYAGWAFNSAASGDATVYLCLSQS